MSPSVSVSSSFFGTSSCRLLSRQYQLTNKYPPLLILLNCGLISARCWLRRQCSLTLADVASTLLTNWVPPLLSSYTMTIILGCSQSKHGTQNKWSSRSAFSLGAMWEAAAPLCITSDMDCDKLVSDKMASDNAIAKKSAGFVIIVTFQMRYTLLYTSLLPAGSLLYKEKAFATLSKTFSPWLAFISKKSTTIASIISHDYHMVWLPGVQVTPERLGSSTSASLSLIMPSTCSMAFTSRSCVPPAKDWRCCSCNWLSSDPLSCSSSTECCVTTMRLWKVLKACHPTLLTRDKLSLLQPLHANRQAYILECLIPECLISGTQNLSNTERFNSHTDITIT